MFQAYFEKLENHLIKKYKNTEKKPRTTKSSKTVKKTTKKSAALATVSVGSDDGYDDLLKAVSGIIPDKMTVLKAGLCDSSATEVETVSFLAIERRFRAVEQIFSKCVPVELVRGAYNIVEKINHKQLVDVLVDVANCKKIGQYAVSKKESPFFASFIIAFDSIYSMEELKSVIREVYDENSVDPRFEFDLLVVLGKGIIIKDWSKKSSFIALDTDNDTLMWFFIIMNEFLAITSEPEFDLREYIRAPRRYDEY